MLRAALYARFSTDQQSAASTEDQLRICRATAERLGAEVVGEFEDAGISGSAMANRPGLQALLRLARAKGFDLLIAEHTDRLSRGGGDSWAIFEDLKALGVRYVTVNQGEITAMHIGMSGTMSVLMIEEGARKTRRGLEGVVLSGRSAGGMAYGYLRPNAYDASGERIRGLREVDETKAAIVRRIFRDFASGVSPMAMADTLNREGVQPPRGTHWLASSIIGSAQRGTGMLRNELYRGIRVWGRLSVVKDRLSGKRRTVAGSGSVQRVEVPELRIIDEALWARVQAKLRSTSAAVIGTGQHRPLHLFSGLIRCGACGGAMTSAGTGGYLRCSGRSNRGGSSCSNTRNPSYPRIEAIVLEGIEANLLHPVAVEEAMRSFRTTLERERKTGAQQRGPLERELEDVKRRAARLIREVEEGMPWSAAMERHGQLVARQNVLEALLRAAPASEVVTLHTGAAKAYRAFVCGLRGSLGASDPAGARDAVRGLIEEVRFTPLPRKGAFDLDITADLAPVMGWNETGSRLMEAMEAGSCSARLHRLPVKFRMAG